MQREIPTRSAAMGFTEVVIIGSGTAAEFATRAAHGMGAMVKIFDNSLQDMRILQNNIGTRLYTSVFHPRVLERTLRSADVVIGATHDENLNIMAGQIAKNNFKVPKVLVRILDPNKESFCRKLDVEYICTTSLAAEKMIAALYQK